MWEPDTKWLLSLVRSTNAIESSRERPKVESWKKDLDVLKKGYIGQAHPKRRHSRDTSGSTVVVTGSIGLPDQAVIPVTQGGVLAIVDHRE
jgi:hypothetical protein